MKKEYLILTGVILILGVYLFVHKENRDHYSLPRIQKIDTKEITGIDIIKDEQQISFSKTDKNWTLTDTAYPADTFQVDTLLNVYKSFQLTTLVSEKGDLNRYELDKKQGIQIQYLKGKDVVFGVVLGKTAPTFNHTFVKLSEDKNIYHAAGSLRSDFDKEVEAFRDKNVLTFNKSAIKQFTVAKDNLSETLMMTQKQNDKKQDIISWNFEDDTQADIDTVAALLSVLSDLRCETYSDDTRIENLKEQALPFYRVSLKGTVDHELTLYKDSTDKKFIGVSSMNKYVFVLSRHNEKQIITSIEKLLGIYTPEDTKE
ncbi:MAG: DUF4340 domain-containing protein [Proteobacteria bacterium]|nr:DUF4340 domain-containing protein [Pseudomonadota bacterium]MBU1389619.1 DUF4340 domain-containing protein [Pseudomonadota bacterium]MBU1542557.1 DUF4340 domain-containing protein [Pseudomonadota bacterium]MBU2429333.1 DUF4340 domain-containing protein [Pseudomonadota bacterium]MBU2479480.1 DUF4340 domain-containing protein [Pseudomonadota bacterium]